jgi:hypothetical protein
MLILLKIMRNTITRITSTAIIFLLFYAAISSADDEVDKLRLAFSGLKPKSIRLDRNFDGIVDRIEIYDDNGNLTKTETDTSHAGINDEIVYYQNKLPIKAEKDHNADTQIDHIILFDDNGIVKTATFDTNFDNKIDVWVEYQNGIPFKLQKDINFDGKIDTLVSYDENGNIVKTEPINDPDDKPVMWQKDDAENVLFFNDGTLY